MSWAAIITAVVGSVGGFLIGFFNYKQSRQRDSLSAQSQVDLSTRAGIAQVTQSMNQLMERLQEDNQTFRDDSHIFRSAISECSAKLAIVQAERDEARLERDEARRELAILRLRLENLGSPHIS